MHTIGGGVTRPRLLSSWALGWVQQAGGLLPMLTFSLGRVLFLQDNSLSIQTRYWGTKVQGLLLSTLKAEVVH